MKILRLLFILFCLTIAAVAQEQRGTITGTVTDENGAPVAGAKISVKLKDSVNYDPTVERTTDENGNFTVIALRLGIYIVKAESSCLSKRDENIPVLSEKKTVLNIELPDENCAEKEAKEQLEWKACEQETSVAGLQISDAEKAEIVNQMLEELLKTDFLGYREEGVITSTENIEPIWIKSFPNLKLTFLSPQKIQAKADKEGDLGYLSFSAWRPGNSCVFIGLTYETAVSKTSKNSYCSQGSSRGFLFRKDSGKWKMKQLKIF